MERKCARDRRLLPDQHRQVGDSVQAAQSGKVLRVVRVVQITHMAEWAHRGSGERELGHYLDVELHK